MYQNVTELRFYEKKFSTSSEFYYLEPGFYPSNTDFVEAKNTLIQERHNHFESYITVKVSRRTQDVEIYLANEVSGLVFLSTDLGHISASNVGNEMGVMLRENGHHEPEFAYDIVRIQSLMIYTYVIDFNISSDTKAPLLRSSLFISKLNTGDNITTGQYMIYQTFSKLQFRPLIQKLFHSIHIDQRNTSGGKIPFVPVGILRLVLLLRRASNNHF